MPQVTLYTKPYCPFCTMAKRLLDAKGVTWAEINLEQHPERRMEMIEKAQGRSTVPQVFVDDLGLGGFDELNALDMRGELDGILGV